MHIPKSILASLLSLLVAAAQPIFADDDAGTCTAAGPQSPRDIDSATGTNGVTFAMAPSIDDMHLCDIHFHKFAEHRASAYSTLAGEGDHKGYACKGSKPSDPSSQKSGAATDGCGGLSVGDTVEVHWVFTSCDVEPGPKLDSCFSPVCLNPQLRVEARVFHLTKDSASAIDFVEISNTSDLNVPAAGEAVRYLGSTTGPSFSDKVCSPAQVTWNVSPTCEPLDLASLGAWCDDNVFLENKAHGVRKLVTDPNLLSKFD